MDIVQVATRAQLEHKVQVQALRDQLAALDLVGGGERHTGSSDTVHGVVRFDYPRLTALDYRARPD